MRILKNNLLENGKRYILAQHDGVCSQGVEILMDGITIEKVNIIGGCMGNTMGLAALLEGMSAKDASEKLKGVDCNGKGTSCPDQLSQVLAEVLGKL